MRVLWDLLFPQRCVGCRRRDTLLCQACESGLRFLPPTCFVCKKIVPAKNRVPLGRTCLYCRQKSHIYAFFSSFSYDSGAIRELVHGLKYERIRAMASVLSRLLASALAYYRVEFPAESIVIPVPLYPARQRVRGFNQSYLIAQELAERLGYPVDQCVEKIRKTKPQMELRREERIRNLAGAFVVKNPDSIRGKTILLVDDVRTTGTTLEEIATTLRHAGAKRIWAITAAH